MKQFIVSLFVISLLAVGFLALNYLWDWITIDYTTVLKVLVSVLVLVMISTGLAMVFSSAYPKNSKQPNVGKKD